MANSKAEKANEGMLSNQGISANKERPRRAHAKENIDVTTKLRLHYAVVSNK